MSRTVAVFAPAKINLALHVTGQREDGYHLLDSLVAFADVGDRLFLSDRGPAELTIGGPEAADVPRGIDNIVFYVAAKFWEPTIPLSFRLEKNLPVAAGIGGGSADAAACYRGLLYLRGLAEGRAPRNPAPEDVAELFRIGADVPACVLSDPARMRGFGEQLDPVPDLPALPILLVNPRVSVPTPDVFRALKSKENPGLADLPPDIADPDALIAWLAGQRNDLETPALSIAPVVAEVLKTLRGLSGCRLARMSGSGATCFALFDSLDAAETQAAELSARRPGWWIRAGRLNGGAMAAPQLIRATT